MVDGGTIMTDRCNQFNSRTDGNPITRGQLAKYAAVAVTNLMVSTNPIAPSVLFEVVADNVSLTASGPGERQACYPLHQRRRDRIRRSASGQIGADLSG